MKILIIKLSSLGDVIHAIPTVNAISEIYPQAKIDWLVYSRFAELLDSQESINRIHKLEDKKLSSLIDMISKLKAEDYDLVIDLQGLIKTAITARAISTYTVGFQEPRESIAAWFYRDQVDAGDVMDDSLHIIDRNLEVASSLVEGATGYKPEIDFGGLSRRSLGEGGRNDSSHHTCIIPCTTWESKHWTPQYWAKLITEIRDKYHSEISILGTIQELLTIEEIISYTNCPLNIVVHKTLAELPEFFSEMDLIIGVDTGPLHLAAACHYGSDSTQIIGIYGPTAGARTGPYGFEYLSADEITGMQAKHKRYGKHSIEHISPELVFERLRSQKVEVKI